MVILVHWLVDLHNGINASAVSLPHASESSRFKKQTNNIGLSEKFRYSTKSQVQQERIVRTTSITALYLGWPPISHSFMVTFPLVTLRMLNPTVGIMSSENCPDYLQEKKEESIVRGCV